MERKLQKEEALKRMRRLQLHQNVIHEFEQEDKLNFSERAILYWLDEKQQSFVKKFEERTGCLVYHVIHNYTEFGELLSMLYVSTNEEEWQYDMEDLIEGCPYAYVENMDDPSCSEMGRIGIKPFIGGILRTA